MVKEVNDKMAKSVQTRNTSNASSLQNLPADELKNVVRDGLVSMNMSEREDFVRALEGEMEHAGLNIRAYLIPLGIPARSADDLTPTEVGHLVRYLKINVPKAMSAVLRALTRHNIFAEKLEQFRGPVAA
jgi:hypothetical protein